MQVPGKSEWRMQNDQTTMYCQTRFQEIIGKLSKVPSQKNLFLLRIPR